MAILLRIIIILVSVMVALGFGTLGALIIYLTEEEQFTDDDKTMEDTEVQMDTRKM